ncbi:MAG TPA: DNA mismatch endonuclease Vsr [Chthoniobacteraceae bacterium]|nr:DNA mismatch endonuclease Vsr [Opitutaceae bacterium]HWB58072.1 DNA mismatch endonuclease Vsr [Chthoniobacteraceae bacterium]
MADVMTIAQRSALMARIRGRGNESTELLLARLLRAEKIFGWLRHVSMTGRPDFIFRRAKVAVFVDGCFWHGCPRHFKAPQARAKFWKDKIGANKRRDTAVDTALRKSGWRVIRIWEHGLTRAEAARSLRRIRSAIAASR